MKKPTKDRLDWSKFWWKDWQNDLALKSCSYAARGLWMEMLAIMASAESRGDFVIAGRAVTPKQLAGLTNGSEREVVKLVSELRDNGVFSTSDDGVIFSRRMKRDHETREAARANGAMGGNPSLNQKTTKNDDAILRGGLTPQDKPGDKLQEARGKNKPHSPLAGDGDDKIQNPEPAAKQRAILMCDQREFEEFWALYEKKEGKKPAQRAFAKARKTTSHATIMAAVRGWPFAAKRRNGEDFNPNPATWLNQERWNDECVQPAPSASQMIDGHPVSAWNLARKKFAPAYAEWEKYQSGPPPKVTDFLPEKVA